MTKHQPSANFNGNELYVVASVFIVLDIVCVALRFWARKIGKIHWGWDDVLIIPGLIFCLSVSIVSLGEQWPLTPAGVAAMFTSQ
jgi:NADH:ubiquinone oxidoreductase subunit 3 (subunit A)